MGYVYVLSNPSMPGLLKIGCTDRSPEDRVMELSSATGVPTPFRLEFYTALDDSQAAERLIHTQFAGCRVNGSREFFAITVEDVVLELKRLRVTQILELVEALEPECHAPIVTYLIRRNPELLDGPALRSNRLDSAIETLLTWDDESLMKIIDALLSRRPKLRDAL